MRGKGGHVNAKWIGAIFVLAACGGFGFSIAHSYRQRERSLQQLLNTLDMMSSELEYRLTPLPELSRKAARASSGVLRDVFLNLTRELDWQSEPDAGSCMRSAMEKCHDLPVCLRRPLRLLGQTLGRFDLPGQLQGIKASQDVCRRELARLEQNRDVRLRSYQTLGLCAGAALVILFV